MTKKSQARIAATRITRTPDATAGTRQPTRTRKAKTAYELLERVCEAITMRPLSYYQNWWSGKANHCMPDDLAAKNECGTVFCRAGWMVAINDGHQNIDVSSDKVTLGDRRTDIADRAYELLGMDSDNMDVCDLFSGGEMRAEVGSRAYAREGVAGLRRFMKKHATHLKNRSLRGV